MILFLELAVLNHPGYIECPTTDAAECSVATWRPFAGPKYVRAPELLEVLRPYLPQTEIVISDWGITWPNDTLKTLLPADLSARTIDVVWMLDIEDYRSDLADLNGSIHLWLRHRRPNFDGSWLCISNQYYSWPEQERHRLITGDGLGSPWLRTGFEEAIRVAYGSTAGGHQRGGPS